MPESSDPNAEHAQVAVRIVRDPSREHLGAVYAEALMGAAETAGDVDAVVEQLDAVVDEVLERVPRLDDVFASPWVSADEKVALLDQALAGHVSTTLLNFLKVTARHGRLDILRAIRRHVRSLYEERRGRVAVELTTATEVSDRLARRLTKSLADMLDGEPVIQRTVDPSLIGGAVLRVGDRVYDGSIVHQLQSLREQLIHRSADEIQRGRDRFRDPAGN
jgi:F-type H+-transporting ATPase subunit delta